MRTVRVFISSPSDALRERDRLARVARRLNLIYAEVVELEIIRWEDDFYSAHDTFQTQIPEAKACDIVIGILKHRLGSPLPSTFPPMPEREPFLGEPYPSGTAYEILSSIANRLFEDSDKPDIYVFRDAEPPVVTLGTDDMERIGREWRRLEDFARRFFFTAEGDFRFAFQTFRSANQFEQQIESLLRKWIETNVYAEHRSVWPVDIKGSPFRALDVFDYAHRDVFFGRDRDTARIVDLLAETAAEAEIEGSQRLPFLLLTGPSGAGKSSLLRAGVLPTVAESDIGNTEQWRVAITTPSASGRGPFAMLAAALLGDAKAAKSAARSTAKGDVPSPLPELRDGPFATPEALAKLLAHGDASAALVVADALHRIEKALAAREKFENPPKVRLLLVVDQLDEIFSGDIPDADRAAFANLLSELARTGNVWITASLRAGLYENLLSDPAFLALRNAGATYELGPPGGTELADIVRKPAQAADIIYEKDPATGLTLDEVLLADFDRPDMLPLLQFTLEALFQRRETRDGVIALTHAAYRQMNGIAGAVETAADAAMALLDEGERQKLPKLLRRLVTVGNADEGETAPVVLNEVPAADIRTDGAMLRLAEALTETRILVAGGSSSDARTFRLAHQRLLTLWTAAEAALRENATFYRVFDDLDQAYRRWRRNGGRGKQLIHDPGLLTEATRLAQAYPDEIPAESLDFLRRSRLRARLGTIALGTSALVFALLFAGTIWFYYQAREAEALALDEKRKAEENLRIAQTTLQGVIIHVANGLQNVEGMTIASRRQILGRVASAVDLLQRGSDGRATDETRMLMAEAFGQTYAMGGDVENALRAYRDVIALNRRLLDRADGPPREFTERGTAIAYERIGDLLLGQGKRQDAEEAYRQAYEIRKALLAKDPDDETLKRDLSVSIDRLAQSRQAKGDLAGALKLFEEGAASIRAKLKKSPDDPEARRDLSIALEHIVAIEKARGNVARAGELADEVLAIRRSASEADPGNSLATEDLVVALLKRAEIKRVGGDAGAAASDLEQALGLTKRLVATDPEKVGWQRHLAVTLNSLAEIALAKRDAVGALANYEAALAISRRMAGVAPNDVSLQGDVWYTLNKIGGLRKNDRNHDGAMAAFEEALGIARALSSRDAASLDARRNVAVSLGYIADTRIAMGQLAEARAPAGEALDIAEALFKAEPSNRTWQIDVAANAPRVGDLDFAAGRFADARKAYQRTVDMYKQIMDANPELASWRRDQAVNLNKLGDAAASTSDIEGAASAYGGSLGIVEQLLAEQPADDGLKWYRAFCLGKLASVDLLKRDTASAKERYRTGLAIIRDLAARNPGNHQYQADFAFSLVTVSGVQSEAERAANLEEAAAIADRLDKADLADGRQKALPGLIRDAVARARATAK